MKIVLNFVLFLPVAGALVLLMISRHRPGFVRWTALLTSMATFALTLVLAVRFDPGSAAMQFATNQAWMESPTIRYHIAVDGISLFLILLVALLGVLCVLGSWRSVSEHVNHFFFFLLLLESGAIGVFLAMDLLLMYVFWELTLVSLCSLIGIWGQEERTDATVKVFLNSAVGSLLMLVGILWLYHRFGTFDYETILAAVSTGSVRFSAGEELWLFLAFFAAFAVKIPLFPLHTWLPAAHAGAPTAGSVFLAGVFLKMGTYGLLRFCLPLFPDASHALAPAVLAVAIVGIIYGSLVAMVQPDLTQLVAYLSMAQLGFVVLGIFSFNAIGVQGAIYQMLSHGVTTGTLFLIIGMIYERTHTRTIAELGGLAAFAPVLASLFFIATLASIGLPLLNNFVGEFLILLGLLQEQKMHAVFGATGIVLSAVCMLRMYHQVFFGKSRWSHSTFPDLGVREKSILAISVVVMLCMGVASPYFLDRMSASTGRLLDHAGSREIRVKLQTIPQPPPDARSAVPPKAQLPDCESRAGGPMPAAAEQDSTLAQREPTIGKLSSLCHPTI